jgi:hypothetical protein
MDAVYLMNGLGTVGLSEQSGQSVSISSAGLGRR